MDENYEQSYAVVVSIEHSKRIDLYNQIRLRNKERVIISLKEQNGDYLGEFVMIMQMEEGDTKGGIIIPKDKYTNLV